MLEFASTAFRNHRWTATNVESPSDHPFTFPVGDCVLTNWTAPQHLLRLSCTFYFVRLEFNMVYRGLSSFPSDTEDIPDSALMSVEPDSRGSADWRLGHMYLRTGL